MAEDDKRSDEGLSTTTKIVAGTALGVAVPAAAAAARKLMGGGHDDRGQEGRESQSARSRPKAAATRARSAATKRATSTKRAASGAAKRASSSAAKPSRTSRPSSSSAKTPTREQLYRQAKRLKIDGRSSMTKAQLERAVERAKR
jgi:hypothetical protein